MNVDSEVKMRIKVKKSAWPLLKPALKGSALKVDFAFLVIALRKHVPVRPCRSSGEHSPKSART